MDLRQFVNEGLATRQPIKRSFRFGGDTIEGYFLDLPALQVREMMRLEAEDRDAIFLAAVLCDEKGAPLMSIEQARLLRPAQLAVLINEALAALGLGDEGRDGAKKP